jgi:hypothetical protein
MKQIITVSPDGTVSGLQHKKGQGLDLRTLGGHAHIERASEVVWNDTIQAWFVEFRNGAGPYAGRVLTLDLLAESGIDSETFLSGGLWHANPASQGGSGALFFSDYDDGVRAEIAVLNRLRLAGLLRSDTKSPR